MYGILVAGLIIGVGLLAYTVMVLYNAHLQRKAERLAIALLAANKLKHAIAYLEPLGSGTNLEWANARTILELALFNVLYEVQ